MTTPDRPDPIDRAEVLRAPPRVELWDEQPALGGGVLESQGRSRAPAAGICPECERPYDRTHLSAADRERALDIAKWLDRLGWTVHADWLRSLAAGREDR